MNALRIGTPGDESFARFLAASARKLKRDLSDLTPIGAFDLLQKIHDRYADRWASLWIVCWDGHTGVSSKTPLQSAIEQIKEHGGAIGIVGVTIVNRTVTAYRKQLRTGKDKHGKDIAKQLDITARNAVDRVLQIAAELAEKARAAELDEKSRAAGKTK